MNKYGDYYTIIKVRVGKFDILFDNGVVKRYVTENRIFKGTVSAKNKKHYPEVQDKIGQKFGNLIIKKKGMDSKVICDCICGKEYFVDKSLVFNGSVTSCGCIPQQNKLDKFWTTFNEYMSKWNPTTHHSNTKKLPLFKFKIGSVEITGISGFTYVNSEFYDKWKDYPFIKVGQKYVALSQSKHVAAKLRGGSKIKMKKYLLHHLVRGHCNFANYLVDHKNGNGLDNRFNNLRTATTQQNGFNSKTGYKNKTSKYKGVGLRQSKKRCWRATIDIGKTRITKSFYTELEAALFYDEMARLHHGEFALTNF